MLGGDGGRIVEEGADGGGSGRGVAGGDFSFGQESLELFGDASVVVADDRAAEAECFKGGAAE